jgi:hypothetical protein
VQEEQLHRWRVADPLGPDAEIPVGRSDRYQLDAAAEQIVATGVIQIGGKWRLGGAHSDTLRDICSARLSCTSEISSVDPNLLTCAEQYTSISAPVGV